MPTEKRNRSTHFETVTLNESTVKLLRFLADPLAYYNDPQSSALVGVDLSKIQRTHSSVYSSTDTQSASRQNLRKYLDKISVAAQRVLNAKDENGNVRSPVLRTALNTLTVQLRKITTAQEILQTLCEEGVAEGSEQAHGLWFKMFCGTNLLEGIVIEKTRVLEEFLSRQLGVGAAAEKGKV